MKVGSSTEVPAFVSRTPSGLRCKLATMENAPLHDASRVTHFRCEPALVDGDTLNIRSAAYIGDEQFMTFTEVITLPASLPSDHTGAIADTVKLLSLAVSLSYFKAFAPATYVVPEGLTEQQRRFLSELISNGLGEFAYVNALPEVLDTQIEAPTIEPSVAQWACLQPTVDVQETGPFVLRPLVAVGGGKDSIVSIDVMQRAGLDYGLFAVNAKRPMHDTAEVAGKPLTEATRTLDSKLFELNRAGAPNGHVPVTAINSLIAVLTAIVTGHDAVVLSNEASASYGNLHWNGRTINHQWSKSSEFEALLRQSLPQGSPAYFSVLRPLTEIRIARRFAELREFHGAVTSCNRAFRLQNDTPKRWCGDCPKCRFVFLMLAPFMSRAQLLTIFESNDLLSDLRQRDGFFELMGAQGIAKPFECVGEPDECRVALSLLQQHPEWTGHEIFQDPRFAALTVPPHQQEQVFAWRNDPHFLPRNLEDVVREV